MLFAAFSEKKKQRIVPALNCGKDMSLLLCEDDSVRDLDDLDFI